jgi:hypothetical protein
VTPDQVAGALGCGPDVDEHVGKIKPFIDTGFTEIALVQIGADQQAEFMTWAEQELLPELRSLQASLNESRTAFTTSTATAAAPRWPRTIV